MTAVVEGVSRVKFPHDRVAVRLFPEEDLECKLGQRFT